MIFAPVKNKTLKIIYLTFGIIFLFIGLIGLIMPVIPGFIFLIPAVTCFAKASGRFHGWISRSKRFGKYFKDEPKKHG